MQKQENMTNSQVKRQLTDTNPEMIQMWNYQTDFKAAIITILNKVKVSTFEINEREVFSREIEIITKESNGNFRTEMYNM